MYRSLKEFQSYKVSATDKDLNSCIDLLIDDESWALRYLVLDTHKWLPLSRKVVVSPLTIQQVDWDEKHIQLNESESVIKDSPNLNEHEPVSREYEHNFFRYYGYGYYWMGAGLWGTVPHPAPFVDDRQAELKEIEKGNSLRSLQEILGYSVYAHGEKVGELKDLVLNPREWNIEFIVVSRPELETDQQLLRIDLVDGINCQAKVIQLNVDAKKVAELLDEAVA